MTSTIRHGLFLVPTASASGENIKRVIKGTTYQLTVPGSSRPRDVVIDLAINSVVCWSLLQDSGSSDTVTDTFRRKKMYEVRHPLPAPNLITSSERMEHAGILWLVSSHVDLCPGPLCIGEAIVALRIPDDQREWARFPSPHIYRWVVAIEAAGSDILLVYQRV